MLRPCDIAHKNGTLDTTINLVTYQYIIEKVIITANQTLMYGGPSQSVMNEYENCFILYYYLFNKVNTKILYIYIYIY